MDDFRDEEFQKYVEETEHLMLGNYDQSNIIRYFYSESTGFYVSSDWSQIGWIEEDNKNKTIIIKELKNYSLDFFICSCIVEDVRRAKNLELLRNYERVNLEIIPIKLI